MKEAITRGGGGGWVFGGVLVFWGGFCFGLGGGGGVFGGWVGVCLGGCFVLVGGGIRS